MKEEFSVEERIEIGKMYLDLLKRVFREKGMREDPSVRHAKIWNRGDLVRIYGLSDDSGFLSVTRYGDVIKIGGNPVYEVEEAIDEFHDYLYSRRRDLEKWMGKKAEKKEEEKPESKRPHKTFDKFLKKKYDSAQKVYDDIRKELDEIEGVSDKQERFAENIRRNIISGLANHIYESQRAKELENDLMREEEERWLKKYKEDYEFALSENSAKKLLDRFANTGFRYDAL